MDREETRANFLKNSFFQILIIKEITSMFLFFSELTAIRRRKIPSQLIKRRKLSERMVTLISISARILLLAIDCRLEPCTVLCY